jgi:hypothetical protein
MDNRRTLLSSRPSGSNRTREHPLTQRCLRFCRLHWICEARRGGRLVSLRLARSGGTGRVLTGQVFEPLLECQQSIDMRLQKDPLDSRAAERWAFVAERAFTCSAALSVPLVLSSRISSPFAAICWRISATSGPCAEVCGGGVGWAGAGAATAPVATPLPGRPPLAGGAAPSGPVRSFSRCFSASSSSMCGCHTRKRPREEPR